MSAPQPNPAGSAAVAENGPATFRRYLRERFGGRVLKVSLGAGFSCPNRDGTLGYGGCTFCDNRAFSPALIDSAPAVTRLRRTIDATRRRYRWYLPYLQPFSNTWGSVDALRGVYEPLLAMPGVIGLAIGTRPDCFLPGVHDYLAELAQRTFLVVEVGLQSAHNCTLEHLNRRHTVEQFVSCIRQLRTGGSYTVAHVMLGLPGEGEAEMMATARRLASLPVCGVKLHQTMVIAGTGLENEYRASLFEPLSLEQYRVLAGRFVSLLRPDQHLHRLYARSTIAQGLIAPLWSEGGPDVHLSIQRAVREMCQARGVAGEP